MAKAFIQTLNQKAYDDASCCGNRHTRYGPLHTPSTSTPSRSQHISSVSSVLLLFSSALPCLCSLPEVFKVLWLPPLPLLSLSWCLPLIRCFYFLVATSDMSHSILTVVASGLSVLLHKTQLTGFPVLPECLSQRCVMFCWVSQDSNETGLKSGLKSVYVGLSYTNNQKNKEVRTICL